jgi:hypothetical protein
MCVRACVRACASTSHSRDPMPNKPFEKVSLMWLQGLKFSHVCGLQKKKNIISFLRAHANLRTVYNCVLIIKANKMHYSSTLFW